MRSGAKRIKAGVAIGLLCLFGVTAGQAAASDYTYKQVGHFGTGPGSLDGEFNGLRRIAVYDVTGAIYAADEGNDRVQVFAPGDPPTHSFNITGIDAPFGVAVDQSSGDLYVSAGGDQEIVKLSPDNAANPTAYAPDPGFVSPALGTEAAQIGNFSSPLAVAPNGDLVVADTGNNVVKRFDSSGGYLDSFDGSTSGAAFTAVIDLAVSPAGDVYVVDALGRPVADPRKEASNPENVRHDSRIERFDADGAHLTTIAGLARSDLGLVGFDPNVNQVIGGDVAPNSGGTVAMRLDGTPVSYFVPPILEPDGWAPVYWESLAGIAVDGGPSQRLYLGAFDGVDKPAGYGAIAMYEAVILATLTVDPVDPGTVTASGAEISGTVNPEGFATTWKIEVNGVTQGSGSLPASSTPQAVQVTAAGLEPSMTYDVSLIATNANGTSTETVSDAFTTDAIKAEAMTRFVAPRTQTSARLNGFVNPHNAETEFQFEYVTEATYQESGFDGEVAETPLADAGDANAQKLISAEVSGLSPGAAYRYRLVTENVAGESAGEPLTFTTRTAAEAGPPARGIELVNNPEKGNQDAQAKAMSADGTKVLWSVLGGAPGTPSGRDGVFLSERTGTGPTGWSSRSVLPPIEQLFGGGSLGFNLLFHTPAFSSFLFDATRGLLSNAPHQLVEIDRDGNQSVAAEVDSSHTDFRVSIAASDDLRHWFAVVNKAFDLAHPASTTQLYDFSVDPPRLMSQMPGTGQPPACGVGTVGSAPPFSPKPYSPTATDGSKTRVFFHSQGDDCSAPAQLYVRDVDDPAAEAISGSPVSGPAGAAALIRANARGDEALFVTPARLDPDDANNSQDIYRWREGDANECMTCVVSEAAVSVPTSGTWIRPEKIYATEDFSHVFFFSERELEPGVEQNGLYLLNDGEIRFVADVFDLVSGGLSEDGETVLLDGRGKGITTDPVKLSEVTVNPPMSINGSERVYRYDNSDRSLECLSCRPDGLTTARFGGAYLTNDAASRSPDGDQSGAISADGESAAFLTVEPLVGEDINGVADVYEWRHGKVRLVTDGETVAKGLGEADLMGISADATTVLFKLGTPLTGHERDSMAQLYAARIGGGFAPPPTPQPPCNEESCQGPLAPPPSLSSAASLAFAGSGSKSQRKKAGAKACPKGKRRQKVRGKARCVKKVSQAKKRKQGNAKRKRGSR